MSPAARWKHPGAPGWFAAHTFCVAVLAKLFIRTATPHCAFDDLGCLTFVVDGSHYRYGYEYVGTTLAAEGVSPPPEPLLRHVVHTLARRRWPLVASKDKSPAVAVGHLLGRKVAFVPSTVDLNHARRMCIAVLSSGSIGVFADLAEYSAEARGFIAQLASAVAFATSTGATTVTVAREDVRLAEGAGFIVLTRNLDETHGSAARLAAVAGLLEVAAMCDLPRPVDCNVDEVRDGVAVELAARGFSDAGQIASAMVRCVVMQLPADEYGAVTDSGSEARAALRQMVSCARASLTPDARLPSKSYEAASAACLHVLTQRARAGEGQLRKAVKQVFEPHLTGPTLQLQSDDQAAEQRASIQAAFADEGLAPTDGVVEAAVALDLALSWSKSVIVVGAAGCGKSSVCGAVVRAFNKGKPAAECIVAHRVMPNAAPYEHVFGGRSSDRCRSEPGLLHRVLERCRLHPGPSWLALDAGAGGAWQEAIGDALGIVGCVQEPNGGSFRVPDSVRVLFEVQSLDDLDPSMLGQAAIVHVDDSVVAWSDVMSCWWANSFQRLPRISVANRQLIQTALGRVIPPTLERIESMGLGRRGVSDNSLVSHFHQLLGAFLAPELGTNASRNPSVQSTQQLIMLATVFAYVWSFGSCFPSAHRRAFDEFAKPLLADAFPAIASALPDESSLFDNRVDTIALRFVSWDEAVESESPTTQAVVPGRLTRHHMLTSSYFMHTRQSYALSQALRVAQAARVNIIVVGPPGVGKTSLVSAACGGPRGRDLRRVQLNAHSRPADVMQAVSQLGVSTDDTGTWQGSTFTDESLWSQRVRTLFFDDISEAAVPGSGPSSLEALRAVVLEGGFGGSAAYAGQSLLTTVKVVAAGTDGGAGERAGCGIPPRLRRLFVALRLEEPDEDGVRSMFRPM